MPDTKHLIFVFIEEEKKRFESTGPQQINIKKILLKYQVQESKTF